MSRRRARARLLGGSWTDILAYKPPAVPPKKHAPPKLTDFDLEVLAVVRAATEPLRSVEIAHTLDVNPRRVSHSLGVLRMQAHVTLDHVYGTNFWSPR